jgi:hypothetical protein
MAGPTENLGSSHPPAARGELFFDTLVSSYVDANKNHRFLRREWLAQGLDRKLAEARHRFVLLSAEPGAGKSVFIAQLAHDHPEWLRYFIRRDQRSVLADVSDRSLLLRIGYQFAVSHPELFTQEQLNLSVAQHIGGVGKAGEVVGAEVKRLVASPFYQKVIEIEQHVQANQGRTVGLRVEELFVEPRLLPAADLLYLALIHPALALQRIDPRKQIVVLVDALDEIRYHPTPENILVWLTNCPELPENIRFVLTSRPPDEAVKLFCDKQASRLSFLEIDEQDAHVKEDVKEFVQRLVTEEAFAQELVRTEAGVEGFVQRATDKAHGNLGYLDALARGIDQALKRKDSMTVQALLSLKQLPTDLEGLYAFFLHQIKTAVARERIELKDAETGELYDKPVWPAVYDRVLGVLAVAMEPVDSDLIEQLGEIQADRSWVLRAVDRLLQFLEVIDGRYHFYHATVAEFLTADKTGTDIETKDLYHDPQRWHRQIVASYQEGASSWDRVDWHRVDTYGLRYLVPHVVASERNVLSELSALISPLFVREKRDRFGGLASVLDDIRAALGAAQWAEDLMAMFAWAWLYVGFRDRIAQSVPPDALSLYVRSGKTDQAVALINTLDADNFSFGLEKRRARRELLGAVAEVEGRERALGMANNISDPEERLEAQAEITRRIAKRDPRGALQLIRSLSLEPGPELCGTLARHTATADDAICLAEQTARRGEALTAVAVSIGLRDLHRALLIIQSIPEYSEDSGGLRIRRGSDKALGMLAVAWAAIDTRRSLQLLVQVHNPLEKTWATIEVGALVCRTDADAALSVIDALRADFGPPESVAYELGLARLAASGASEERIRRELRAVAKEIAIPSLFKHGLFRFRQEDVDLVARVALPPLRDGLLAREIALSAFNRLGEYVASKRPRFEDADTALGTVAAALATCDFDGALAFLEKAWVQRGVRDVDAKNRSLLLVVKALAAVDPDQAERMIANIEGSLRHFAKVEAVRAIGTYDRAAALRIIDRVDPRFGGTKAVLLGVLGEALDSSEHDFASTLLSRMPDYVDSDNFLQPMAIVRASLRRLWDGQISSSRKHPFDDRPSWEIHLGKDFWVKRMVWLMFSENKGLDSLKLSEDAYSQSWELASSDPEEALKVIENSPNAQRGWMIVAAGMAATNPAAAFEMYRERAKAARPNPHNSEDEENCFLLLAIILEEIGRTDHGRLREVLRDESLLMTTMNAYEFGKALVTIIDAIAPYDFGLALDLADRITDTSCRSTALSNLVQAVYLSHDATTATPHYESLLARTIRLPNNDRRGVYATFIEATAADGSVPNKIVVDLTTHLAVSERDGFMYSLPRFVEAIYHRTPEVLQQMESELHRIEMVLGA